MKFLIIVGLPASGKSTYIESIKTSRDLILDDFVTKDSVLDAMKKDYDRVIISDSIFCKKEPLNNLLDLIKPNEYEILYYENDYEQCLRNSMRRLNKVVLGAIYLLKDEYNPPRIDLKVWREE